MWKKINNDFYFSHTEDGGLTRIFLTDFLNVWFAIYSQSQFIQCLKESNSKYSKMLESVMLRNASQIFSNPCDVEQVNIMSENDNLILNLTKKFAYNFNVKIKFSKGSQELFFQKITQPLMKSVHELKLSQLELCKLLNEKDIEVRAYRNIDSSMKIPFHERTKKFNENSYLSKFKEHHDIYESSEVANILIKEIKIPKDDVCMSNEIEMNNVKHEIKTEPSSQNEHNDTCELFNGEKPQVKREAKSETECKRENLEFLNNDPGLSPRKKHRKLNL